MQVLSQSQSPCGFGEPGALDDNSVGSDVAGGVSDTDCAFAGIVKVAIATATTHTAMKDFMLARNTMLLKVTPRSFQKASLH